LGLRFGRVRRPLQHSILSRPGRKSSGPHFNNHRFEPVAVDRHPEGPLESPCPDRLIEAVQIRAEPGTAAAEMATGQNLAAGVETIADEFCGWSR